MLDAALAGGQKANHEVFSRFFQERLRFLLLALPSRKRSQHLHQHQETEYTVLKQHVESKAEALAQEAMFAAKAIKQKPCQVRGGPWSSPKPLSEAQLEQVRKVSLCTSLLELKKLVAKDSRTALSRH